MFMGFYCFIEQLADFEGYFEAIFQFNNRFLS